MNKEFIINNIARLTADELFEAIEQGVVTFEELKATGKFIYEKQEKVRALLEVKDRIRLEDEQAWTQAKAIDTIEAYRAYLRQYPNGEYTNNANNKILLKEQSGDEERRELLEDIRNHPRDYSPYRVNGLLSSGQITEDDLINANIITKDGLFLFLNSPELPPEVLAGWDRIMPVMPNRTDIYFFGIPSSGKSCLLAGILHYMFDQALINMDINNMQGRKYANALLSIINPDGLGYVPNSTPDAGINYIEAEIRRVEGTKADMHPVNILEMSGELFTNTYKKASTTSNEQDKKTIGTNSYLHNENRKVIFLVIDYQETLSPTITSGMARQALQFDTILDILDKEKMLEKTDALHIVLTKSDLLPEGAGNLLAAEEFIEKRYKSLRRKIRDYREKYDFRDCQIIPFSLGKFMMDQVFQYDSTYSEKIYKAIIASAFYKPKSKRFKLW